MKLFDFDGVFDRKISEYIEKNATKYTEDQWSDVIPRLYEKFGDTVINKIGKTPKQYYAEMDDNTLVQTLKQHIKEDVPVSDFLCRELEVRNGASAILELFKEDDEELINYAIVACGNQREALLSCLNIVTGEYSEDLRDAATERVREAAHLVKEELLEIYDRGVEESYVVDLLSRTGGGDDRVFEILLKEFLNNLHEAPIYAAFLAYYGDERALPYLMEEIKNEDINYIEFQELKYAIEALGGEYNEPRDFSNDKFYQQIHGASEVELNEILKAAQSAENKEN